MSIKIYGKCPNCNKLKARFTDDQVEKLPLIMEEFIKHKWETQPMITCNDELVKYKIANMDDAEKKINKLLKGEK